MFSKKATQIDKIFTVYLTFTKWCQIIGEDFINLCGLLRKNELYSTGFNEWFLLFFSGRRVFCTQAMKNCCSLEFIHGVFLKKRAAIYKIPIKPCVKSLIQRYSVERIRLNKTWMTLKLTKILVSLLAMKPLKKMIRALTIRNMILSFCIKILLKLCKYWKQLYKVFFSVVQNHSTDIASILQVLAPWVALQKYPSNFNFYLTKWK